MLKKYITGLGFILLSISIGLNIKFITQHKQHSQSFIDSDSHRSQLMLMSCGFLVSRAIQVFAQLKIADHLIQPQKIDVDFAAKLNLNQEMLYRLLRMLSGHGIVYQNKDNTFSLTAIGEYLRSDHPETLCNFLEMEGNAQRWNSYSKLDETLKTGKTSFDLLYNEDYFSNLKKNDQAQDQFNRGMNDISHNENIIIADFFKNKSMHSLVDVGGGVGELLREMKKANAHLQKAILFDYTPLTVAQKNLLDQHSVQFVQGSFFDKNIIPQGKDLYILKRILHDWSDKQAAQILTQVADSLSSHSKLYIIDCIMDDSNNYHISKDIDFEMMVLFGGKERTREEFSNIITSAGLTLQKIHTLENSMLSILEVVKK